MGLYSTLKATSYVFLLSIRFGDLGLYSAVEATSYAFVASRAQTWVLQDHILRDSDIYGMNSDYDGALASLRNKLPDSDISSFTIKDTSLNPRIHWRVPFFIKLSKLWNYIST